MAYREVTDGGAWNFEANEKLEGVIKGRETRQGQNKKDYTVFTIEEKEGREYQVWGAVLESKLGMLEDGTKVLITYKGEQRGKGGNHYKDFSVMEWYDE